MNTVGRGRGWLHGEPDPVPLRRPRGLADGGLPSHLISKVNTLDLNSVGVPNDLSFFLEDLRLNCRDRDTLNSIVKQLHDRSLEDRQFGIKAAKAFAAASMFEVDDTKLRVAVLCCVQKDFEAFSVAGLRQSPRQRGASVSKKVTHRSSKQDKMESVNFLLYTRGNTDSPLLLNPDEVSTLQTVDAGKETVFLIHGWLCNRTTFMKVKNAYLQSKDVNVVIVEWDQLAGIMYPKSKKNLNLVGSRVAQLADLLIDAGQDPAKLHIAGHSLGGHASGIAASQITKGKIGRVTALDPAGPSFKSSDLENMVDSSDAVFVQVIHVNGGTLGYKKPLGHADFNVNDGQNQPGCFIGDMGICSHMRVIDLFEQSVVDGKSFPAHKCPTWEEFSSGMCNENPVAYMGESCSTSTQGVYYLKTGSVPPYIV